MAFETITNYNLGCGGDFAKRFGESMICWTVLRISAPRYVGEFTTYLSKSTSTSASPSYADYIIPQSKSTHVEIEDGEAQNIQKYKRIYCYVPHKSHHTQMHSSLTVAQNEIFIVVIVVSLRCQYPPPSRRSCVFGDPRLSPCLAFRNSRPRPVAIIL